MHSSQFTYQDASSTVYKSGTGSTNLLILHGWGSNYQNWGQLLDKLPSEKFTTYFLDLPGFGKSKSSQSPWNIQNYAEFVLAFIQNNNLSNLNILAHSFGGRISIYLLTQHPDLFQKVVFLNIAGIKPKLSKFAKIVQFLIKTTQKVFGENIFKNNFLHKFKVFIYKLLGSHDYLQVDGTLKETFLKVIREDLEPKIPEITHKVLLIWGENDTYTPLYMGQKIDQLLPDSELIVLSDARHGIHRTHSEIVVNHLLKFLT